MKRWLKILLSILAVLLLLCVIGLIRFIPAAQPILAGYHAKIMCSCVFVSERQPELVSLTDLALYNPLDAVHTEVDQQAKTVRIRLGGASKVAVYHEDLGCTLLKDPASAAKMQARKMPKPELAADSLFYRPLDATRRSKIDVEQLNKAIEEAFVGYEADQDPGTRAVVVIYDSFLVAERYAPGFSAQTRLAGWSMNKSVTQALTGFLVQAGTLDIHAPAPVPEWQNEDDPRQAITLDQLLRMSSGLSFSEFYFSPWADAPNMLFNSADVGAFASKSAPAHAPDSAWSYSSGTTNLISRILRERIGEENYLRFPYDSLFDRIGMHSAVMETDESGTYVGSSFLHATARDWARFGLFYLWEGEWMGQRLLPKSWIDYAKRPTPKAPQGRYGAQFWLNAGDAQNPSDRKWPSLPQDLFYPSGYEGQYVFIFPTQKLVVVRLGATPIRAYFKEEQFLNGILKAFPAES